MQIRTAEPNNLVTIFHLQQKKNLLFSSDQNYVVCNYHGTENLGQLINRFSHDCRREFSQIIRYFCVGTKVKNKLFVLISPGFFMQVLLSSY